MQPGFFSVRLDPLLPSDLPLWNRTPPALSSRLHHSTLHQLLFSLCFVRREAYGKISSDSAPESQVETKQKLDQQSRQRGACACIIDTLTLNLVTEIFTFFCEWSRPAVLTPN